MKKFLVAGIAAAAFCGAPALATDMPTKGPVYKAAPAPVFNWTGFYIGGNVGWASGKHETTDIIGAVAIQTFGQRNSGVLAGGQAGMNWQSGALLFGIEGDLGYMGIGGHSLEPGSASNTQFGIRSGLYGDVTARAGFVAQQALFYAKGGWAFYDGREFFSTQIVGGATNTHIGMFSGWTAGAGIEWIVGPNWTAKIEYQHFDFGHQNFTITNPILGTFPFREGLTADSAKVGLNYRFGSR